MPGIDLEVDQYIDRDLIEIIGPREEELYFEASKNYGLEPEAPAGIAGVSSEIYLVGINDVIYTQLQEGRSVRQQEVISTTDNS